MPVQSSHCVLTSHGNGSTASPPTCSPQCRCGPVAIPVAPTEPTTCPSLTTSPWLTAVALRCISRLVTRDMGTRRLLRPQAPHAQPPAIPQASPAARRSLPGVKVVLTGHAVVGAGHAVVCSERPSARLHEPASPKPHGGRNTHGPVHALSSSSPHPFSRSALSSSSQILCVSNGRFRMRSSIVRGQCRPSSTWTTSERGPGSSSGVDGMYAHHQSDPSLKTGMALALGSMVEALPPPSMHMLTSPPPT
eukprot:CAMPEP_0198684186 /NCGR_PEP_ID=MMETSP1468-20131203/11831_1 /TAXON_ID=1461545 /ORGANISM="Mantoniella sp, Strain CCMP1436" /LENGTH=248 /DNA_ID=CAMNT_0044428817 /DNA_START=343 /DNA_END=1091 /DNA_ORIENTATION=-